MLIFDAFRLLRRTAGAFTSKRIKTAAITPREVPMLLPDGDVLVTDRGWDDHGDFRIRA
jgi:hypothetical protein